MLDWAAPHRREALAVAVAALLLAAVVAGRIVALRSAAPPIGVVEGTRTGIRPDLNRAPWWELDLLPDIGEKRAQDIVADREVRGPFRTVDDLGRVKGLTPAIVERLRPLVTVGDAPAGAAAEPPASRPQGGLPGGR